MAAAAAVGAAEGTTRARTGSRSRGLSYVPPRLKEGDTCCGNGGFGDGESDTGEAGAKGLLFLFIVN